MSIKTRLSKAENAAGTDSDPVIFIVRWADDETPIEDMPVTISQGGKVIRRGINTIPAHLRDRHIQLAWPEDD